jgi:uncharacterized phiE125 gp8 family phage protein
MSITQTVAPSVEPVVTADQKTWMRVDGTDEDTLIGSLASAARAYVEMATSRQCITATWVLKLKNFPAGDIVLPIFPLQSITSIKYYDSNDTQQTWSSALYDVDTAMEPGRVRPVSGEDYPSDVRGYTDDIEITFVSGDGDAASDVPDGVLAAIKILAANWFENREANTPIGLTPVPMSLESLIWQYRSGDLV